MNSKKAIAEKLLQINAIKLSVDEPFTWASGWKSPIYCDNRKALSFPVIRDFIKFEMCHTIINSFPDVDLLAGVATAGIPWGTLAADHLKLPFIYVRPKPKDHGLENQIEGFYEKGMKVLVIEDLISTGKSSMEAINVLRMNGIKISGLVSIFTYQFTEAGKIFKNENVFTESLTDYKTLLTLAMDKGSISTEDEKALLKWREDPANWKK